MLWFTITLLAFIGDDPHGVRTIYSAQCSSSYHTMDFHAS